MSHVSRVRKRKRKQWAGNQQAQKQADSAFRAMRTNSNIRRQKAKSFRKESKQDLSGWQADYMHRNDALRRIGFHNYTAYLASELWQAIRLRVLRRDGHHCYGCDCSAGNVHHMQYGERVLNGTVIEPLVAICEDCHKHIEFNKDGDKTSLKAANERLESIRDRRLRTAGSSARPHTPPTTQLCSRGTIPRVGELRV